MAQKKIQKLAGGRRAGVKNWSNLKSLGLVSGLDWLIQNVILLAIFALPLLFWPTLYTTFELTKVVIFRTLVLVLGAIWILRMVMNFGKSAPGRNVQIGRGIQAHEKSPRGLVLLVILLTLIVLSWFAGSIMSASPVVAFYGIYPRFQGLLTMLCYFIFGGIVFFEIGRSEGAVQKILMAIFASTFFVCGFALLQRFGFSWLNFWDTSAFLGRVFGTMAHPDFLAGWLVMIIPLLVAWIMSLSEKALPASKIQKQLAVSWNTARFAFGFFPWNSTFHTGSKRWSKIRTFFCSVTLILALTTLFFTLSRSAFIGLFAAMLVFILIYTKKTGRHKTFWAVLFLPILIVALVIGVNFFKDSALVKNNILLNRITLSGENLRSLETRFSLWPATIKLIKEKPLFGFGPDSFELNFPKYAAKDLNTLENFGDYPDRAHNFLLDYAVQFGLIGLLIFGLLIGFVLYKATQFVFKNPASAKAGLKNGHLDFANAARANWLLILGFICGLIGILVTNQFSFFVTIQWLFFWLFVAILARFTFGNLDGGAGETAPGLLAMNCDFIKIVLVILILAATIPNFIKADFSLWNADLKYRQFFDLQGSGAQNSGNSENLNFLKEAAELGAAYPFYAEEYARTAVQMAGSEHGNVAANSYGIAARQDGFSNDFVILADALAKLETTGQITNYDGQYWFLKAQILAKLGEIKNAEFFPEAFVAFEKAGVMMPAYPFICLEYGKALLAAADSTDYVQRTGSPVQDRGAGNPADVNGAGGVGNASRADAANAKSLKAKAVAQFEKYLSLSPPYYKWKKDLQDLAAGKTPVHTHTFEEREKYRIFYKLNPDFDGVFGLIEEAR